MAATFSSTFPEDYVPTVFDNHTENVTINGTVRKTLLPGPDLIKKFWKRSLATMNCSQSYCLKMSHDFSNPIKFLNV